MRISAVLTATILLMISAAFSDKQIATFEIFAN
jgi:hypothetical protein